MKERTGIVAVEGNPLTLLGEEITIGQTAPGFTALDNALQPVSLDAYKGKVVVLAAVPSLDTPVCDMEIRRFNTEAANLGDNVEIITLSMDLPFAQARWCGAAGVDKVTTLSDHNMADFGQKYGLAHQRAAAAGPGGAGAEHRWHRGLQRSAGRYYQRTQLRCRPGRSQRTDRLRLVVLRTGILTRQEDTEDDGTFGSL